jgi:nicotinate-nucleotide pyrophosphorylase (carboxylating)
MTAAPSLAPTFEPMLSLPSLLIEPVVRAALIEDLGRAGDITTAAVVSASARATGVIAARQAGVVAGVDCVLAAFRLVDPEVGVAVHHGDGSRIVPGTVIATVAGPARAVLTGERVALNFLCQLSGVASGGIAIAVERARRAIGHMVKIEVEVETLAELQTALAAGVDAVLLDNMTPAMLTEAVSLIGGRVVSEASGRITRETVAAVAATGVDVISAGWITHSAPALDFGLDFQVG